MALLEENIYEGSVALTHAHALSKPVAVRAGSRFRRRLTGVSSS